MAVIAGDAAPGPGDARPPQPGLQVILAATLGADEAAALLGAATGCDAADLWPSTVVDALARAMAASDDLFARAGRLIDERLAPWLAGAPPPTARVVIERLRAPDDAVGPGERLALLWSLVRRRERALSPVLGRLERELEHRLLREAARRLAPRERAGAEGRTRCAPGPGARPAGARPRPPLPIRRPEGGGSRGCVGCVGAVGRVSPMSIEATVAELFPIHSRLYSLELIDPADLAHGSGDGESPAPQRIGHNARGDLIVTVRLSVWDGRAGGRVLECVLESEEVMVLAEDLGDPRLRAYLAGWREAVRAVLESHDGLESVELGLEPRDLFSPEVVELRRPRTAAEFCGELLVSGRRLGRLLRS